MPTAPDLPRVRGLDDHRLATHAAEVLDELVGRGRLIMILGAVRATSDTAAITVTRVNDTVTISAFRAAGRHAPSQQGRKG